MPRAASPYEAQLELLVDVLPHVATEPAFALKGGTAINLFFRELPRLSVDIDLAWLPLDDRDDALAGIAAALGRIGRRLHERLRCRVTPRVVADVPVGLVIERDRVPVRIDVTPVLRGTVFEPERRTLSPGLAERFGFVEITTLGFADLFAGKLVAALDRQHPRDLFDVRYLLAHEGISDPLWGAFLVYVTMASRPAAELIDPTPVPLAERFVAEFAGMTTEPVDAADLERARAELVDRLGARLDADACAFLLSVEHEDPDWRRLALPAHVAGLPAVRWKLQNLARRSPEKRIADQRRLASVLERVALRKQGGEA